MEILLALQQLHLAAEALHRHRERLRSAGAARSAGAGALGGQNGGRTIRAPTIRARTIRARTIRARTIRARKVRGREGGRKGSRKLLRPCGAASEAARQAVCRYSRVGRQTPACSFAQ